MRLLLAAVLALVLTPVLARADGWQTSSAEAQGMSSRALAGLVEFGITNGMDSVLVVRHGSIVAEAYYAPFAPGMKHRINSATKSVIGSLVSIALKDGLLASTDQPVLGFFPERTFANMDERKKALRLRHLLDMTSGLEWDEPLSAASFESLLQMERSPDWVQFILDHPMVREPGAAFEYNSGNPHVLSAILSKVTGRSALDYAREKLFGPLGIEDVFWRHDPQGVSGGGAGLYLQPRDMARLGQLWLAGGDWKGERLLAPGWIGAARHASLEMGLGPLLRYANLFWAEPAKGVFLAVGYDRQLIAVMPDLDLVAVFTGGRRISTATGVPSMPKYPLSAVVDRLKEAVRSDGALPEDPAALALLADRTKEVAQEVRTQSAALSPLAAAISGKVYRLQPNPAGFSSFSLSFENGGASYTYEAGGQRFGGPVGLDGLYRVGGHRLYGPSAAKGVWRDDRTFEIEVQTPGNDDVGVATMTFDGKSVSGRVAASGTWIELKGEAE
jgi:CubicO group peptidase (beta-lactamase class C family)